MELEDRNINTQIPVSKKTRQQLRNRGEKGQTYDKIIQKLINEIEK